MLTGQGFTDIRKMKYFKSETEEDMSKVVRSIACGSDLGYQHYCRIHLISLYVRFP